MRALLTLLLVFTFSSTSLAAVVTKDVEYKVDDTTLKGYLAYDDSVSGRRPGILVVHEWWGHNEHARSRASMLAELGYTALAIDMYGNGETADHPKKAGELMNDAFANWDRSQKRFFAGMKLLQSQETVDPQKIGAIGFCFGGAVSIRMARSGADLDGVVGFHSALPKGPAMTKGDVKASILVMNGSEDSFLKSDEVATFMKEMMDANVDATYINLSGIKHSYTNKKADEFRSKFGIKNLEYNKEADERTWKRMQEFFDRVFQK